MPGDHDVLPAPGGPAEARRYAAAFDRRDAADIGKRPLLSLLPLWLARKVARSPKGPS